MNRDILAEIVEKRKADIDRLGISFGFKRPKRSRPTHPFIATPGTILEVKRSSPSKGDIAMGLDPAETARSYAQAGTAAISVLTEGNYFHGALSDLSKVVEAAPDTAVLRKDFLLYPEEVDVAYDFGADAVLLIARILSDETLRQMAGRARSLGMTPFVEVRTEDDLRKLKLVQKDGALVAGVNARDLRNFHIDPLIPAAFRRELGERAVFESGIQVPEDAAFARRLGFEGVLIGESAAKSPQTAKALVDAFCNATPDAYGKFWRCFAEKREHLQKRHPGAPLIKICGMTNAEDALLSAELGADMLGFVLYAKSPRRTTENDVRETVRILRDALGENAPLCVGVVADSNTPEEKSAISLANEGVLDAVQFHGCPLPAHDNAAHFGYYSAVRLKSPEEAVRLAETNHHSHPRTLIDAYVPHMAGGTGKRLADEVIDAFRENSALWLAGGISPQNFGEVVNRFHPELLDLSSALEASPGKKDPAKLRELFHSRF